MYPESPPAIDRHQTSVPTANQPMAPAAFSECSFAFTKSSLLNQISRPNSGWNGALAEIPIVGKPAPEFFWAALGDLAVDPADALMVGDDIGSDLRGAQAIGITGVLVRTGKLAQLSGTGQSTSARSGRP